MQPFKKIKEKTIAEIKQRDYLHSMKKTNLASPEDLADNILKDNKVLLTISRYWHRPQIQTIINRDGIALTISFKDYLKALESELGDNLPIITKRGLKKKMKKITENLEERIKEESAKVV